MMVKNKQNKLGRGLSALLQETEEAYKNNLSDNSDLVLEINVDLISPNPLQPRKYFDDSALEELADSIKAHGILQPVLVYEDDNRYFLIAGERRLRATKLANIDTIKAIIVDIAPDKLRELALIENIQREDLNPIDLAISYDLLIKDYNITQDELSSIVKKSRSHISNTISLLRLPNEVKDAIVSGKLSQGHAKILVNLSYDDAKTIANTIIGQKLSVRDSETLVKNLKNSSKNKSTKISFHQDFRDDLACLSRIVSKMGIDSKISFNSITFSFDELQKIKNLINILNNYNNFGANDD